MFVFIGPEYAAWAERKGQPEEARAALKHVAKMEATVLEHGWDGEWFLRAYDYFGNKVGSHECEEGKILIESQGFCVMAGIGAKTGQAQKALDSVRERLDTPYGIVLNNPAYTRYHIELGEISSYPPGYKENGGIFCHNNPWIMIGETVIGRGDRAFEYYKKIAPATSRISARSTGPNRMCIPDDRRQGRGEQGRGQELVAHRDCRLEFRGHLPIHVGCTAEYDGLYVNPVSHQRPGVYHHSQVPRRDLRDPRQEL